MRLVAQLDTMPAQVIISVLVAEVDLNGSEEFGVEFGLQSPVIFKRGLDTVDSFFGGTIDTTKTSGFQFNNVIIPPGNTSSQSPKTVGFQQLSNLGVGRISPTANVGGFVFSAASDSVNLLIRALRTQSRLDVLSRPSIMTLDNQNAKVNFGTEIPLLG